MTDTTMTNGETRGTGMSQELGSMMACRLRSSLPAAAKAGPQSKLITVALKRCAIQNLVFVIVTSLCLLCMGVSDQAQTQAQTRQQLLQQLEAGQLHD
ncbi:MAG: hypothetical protein LAO19_22500, partial [Acidobacteriia bacterium]|nr:hypothetical protein [Terriglobia bacterium]